MTPVTKAFIRNSPREHTLNGGVTRQFIKPAVIAVFSVVNTIEMLILLNNMPVYVSRSILRH